MLPFVAIEDIDIFAGTFIPVVGVIGAVVGFVLGVYTTAWPLKKRTAGAVIDMLAELFVFVTLFSMAGFLIGVLVGMFIAYLLLVCVAIVVVSAGLKYLITSRN